MPPIMPNGVRCHAPALRGKPYCYFHTRLHKFTAAPPIEVDGNLRLGVLEDRSAIQIARAQVLDALYSSRRDTSASAVARLLLEILPGMQRIEIGLSSRRINLYHPVHHT